MMTERQADVLLAGYDTLVASVARALDETEISDRQAAAQKVLDTVANWLSGYRPSEFGSDYCSPLDTAAYILRKGENRYP